MIINKFFYKVAEKTAREQGYTVLYNVIDSLSISSIICSIMFPLILCYKLPYWSLFISIPICLSYGTLLIYLKCKNPKF